MIKTYTDKHGNEYFKVRVFARSANNPELRITKQKCKLYSLSDAKKIEDKLKKECDRELAELSARGILFGDLLFDWDQHMTKMRVATGLRNPITHSDYVASINKWFGGYLKRPATDLNSYKCAEAFEKMKVAGLGFGHMKKTRQVLKSIFDFGIGTGLVNFKTSPTIDVILKRDEEKKPEILTHIEIQKLIEKAFETEHPWRLVWSAALLTGMRSGELYALRWSDIDFENKTINVNRSYNCRAREFKSTKAGYWRVVPISADLESVLRQQQKTTATSDLVFNRGWEWDKGLQAKVLRAFCYINGLPSIKFHTLRACFATQMLRQGVEPAKVMKVCGWKELKTMQHYVRLAGIETHGITEGLNIFADQKRTQTINSKPRGSEKPPLAFFMSKVRVKSGSNSELA